MTSNKEDIWYVEYHDYDYVKNQREDAIKYEDYDLDPLNKVISHMHSLSHIMRKDNDIIWKFFRLLRNVKPFIAYKHNNYCKYINIWLNKEYRNKGYHIKGPIFDVFKNFVSKLNEVTYRKTEKPCEKYINYLDPDRFNKINLLHGLYDTYNEIETTPVNNSNKACNNLHFLAKNYSESIDKYYDDENLYKKFEHIINLILEKVKNLNYPCANNIYFRTPEKLIKLQEEQEKKAKEEELKRQYEEAERKAKEEERGASEEKLNMEVAEMERQPDEHSRDRAQQLPQSNPLQGSPLEKTVSPSTDHSGSLQTSAMSILPEHTQRFQSLDRSRSPRESLFLEVDTPDRQHRYETEENIPQQENDYAQKDTNRSTGRFMESLGLPRSITEVLGDVDPVPVVGVSGGMGALFLLFKYTPVGTFFRGGRRRMHQIPSTFRGEYPFGFPGFPEYDDRYFGNERYHISYQAE
ncbi:PIR protein [Plasmodium vivax]|uniref:VIR protein n=1 Tax=Plasmodium vivax TaxID=5855 RepID=A0A565A470_PLAVI|nr:PIR protein [Plasmodium vivax]